MNFHNELLLEINHIATKREYFHLGRVKRKPWNFRRAQELPELSIQGFNESLNFKNLHQSEADDLAMTALLLEPCESKTIDGSKDITPQNRTIY